MFPSCYYIRVRTTNSWRIGSKTDGGDGIRSIHNSRGDHVANFVKGQLHSRSGSNVGHYLEREGIFIDMSGRYLGELYDGNRLAYNRHIPYKNVNYGIYGNYGNVGTYGNHGNIGNIGSMSGYEDVNPSKLS